MQAAGLDQLLTAGVSAGEAASGTSLGTWSGGSTGRSPSPVPGDDHHPGSPGSPAQAPSAPVGGGQGAAGSVPDTWTLGVERVADRFPDDDATVPPSIAAHVHIWPG